MTLINHVKQYANDVIHLFYPQVCIGCGEDVTDQDKILCLQCFAGLPVTDYFMYANNPVEQLLSGRIVIQAAGSAFYFTKKSMLQNLMHELKYRGNKEVGLFVGKRVGLAMQGSKRFDDIDIIIPLPLSNRRLHQRGYNQAAIIAKGISEVIGKPVEDNIVIRKINTSTQTGKTRIDRWQNMQTIFAMKNEQAVSGKHLLLVDDIITTGATLEACGEVILSVPGTKLSIATAAHTI